MLKDYQATTTGGDEYGLAAADEQYVEDVSRQITDMTLSGTALQDTWVAEDGTLFVLVALDVETFKDSLQNMTDLSETIRKAVQERADEAFRELDELTQ
jgi:predicted aminopeptidase